MEYKTKLSAILFIQHIRNTDAIGNILQHESMKFHNFYVDCLVLD